MKTQVNQHHSQLGTIIFLVSASILLLAFGIYKTIMLQSNNLLNTHNQANIVPSVPSLNVEYNDLLYPHVYSEEPVEAPLEIKEWMINYSSWFTNTDAETTNETEEYYDEAPLKVEDWMTDLSGWNIAPLSNTNNETYNEKIEFELEP